MNMSDELGNTGTYSGLRLGSSHGVIRGTNVTVTSGSTGHAIGRLGSKNADIPKPPGTPQTQPGRSAGNYFGGIGSQRRTSESDVAMSAIGATATPGDSDDPAWAQETYKTRLNFSRGGKRRTSNGTAVDGVTLPVGMEETIARRSSLINSALGQRPSTNQMSERSKALMEKQEQLRNSSRPTTSDFNGTFNGRGSNAQPALGQSGFESRPTTSGGSVAPVNPITKRKPLDARPTVTNGVGVIHGQKRAADNVKEPVQSGGCCS